MRFISTVSNNLQVILRHQKNIYNPITNELVESTPPLVATFKRRMFETQDKETIQRMLDLIKVRRDRCLRQSYEVHPEDVESAANFFYSEEEILLDKDAQIAELQRQLAKANSEKARILKREGGQAPVTTKKPSIVRETINKLMGDSKTPGKPPVKPENN